VTGENKLLEAVPVTTLRPSGKGRDVKKDILAAFTFIATGFLFYVVQVERPMDWFLPDGECGVVETVWTGGEAPEEDLSLSLKETSRDG
jgi:hypothetical protein